MQSKTRYRWLILSIGWLIYFSFGLINTAIAPLVTPIMGDLGISYTQMGVITGAWQLIYIFTAQPLGVMIDRLGVYRTLLLGVVVISTSSLIKTYWPDRNVSERQLSLNMGLMNLLVPFFGGMPTCHGAGGLAGQYYFGARTGGANIIEGLIEIFMGLFLATSIAGLLAGFPTAIIGAMLLLVGIQLAKFARDIRLKTDLLPMCATIAVSVITNMAFGFVVGLIVHYVSQYVLTRKGLADR